jgi:hypothetical protein
VGTSGAIDDAVGLGALVMLGSGLEHAEAPTSVESKIAMKAKSFMKHLRIRVPGSGRAPARELGPVRVGVQAREPGAAPGPVLAQAVAVAQAVVQVQVPV